MPGPVGAVEIEVGAEEDEEQEVDLAEEEVLVLLHKSKYSKLRVKINKNFQHKFVNIFFTQNFLAYVLGTQKNRLIETVLSSTHNICFG